MENEKSHTNSSTTEEFRLIKFVVSGLKGIFYTSLVIGLVFFVLIIISYKYQMKEELLGLIVRFWVIVLWGGFMSGLGVYYDKFKPKLFSITGIYCILTSSIIGSILMTAGCGISWGALHSLLGLPPFKPKASLLDVFLFSSILSPLLMLWAPRLFGRSSKDEGNNTIKNPEA